MLTLHALSMSIQFNWHDYSVDWEGPVPTDDDNTVEVPEDPDILSASQKPGVEGAVDSGGD